MKLVTAVRSLENPNRSGEKIRLPEKLAYLCANLGNIPVITVLGSFLLIFYTDVVKLDPAAVGILFLIARVADAVFDPIVGYIIDHLPRQKMGRFRPWLILGSILCSINFAAIWLGPSIAMSGKLIIAYITYLLLGPTFATMDISLNSLLPSMTSSARERNSLSTIKGIGYVIGMAVFSMIVVPFVAIFPTQRQGYHVLMVVIAAFVLVMSLIGAFGVRERVEPAKKEKYPFKLLLHILFKTKPLLIAYACSLLVMVGFNVRAGSLIYYLTYNIKSPDLMVIVSLIQLVAMLFGMAFLPMMTNHFEKKRIMITLFIVSGIGAAMLYPVSYMNIIMLFTSIAINNLGMGVILALNYSVQADVVDYVEWQHGYRTEGTIVSVNSFIMKMGQALGGAVPAFILSYAGYVAGSSSQSAETLTGINISISAIPGALTVMASFVFMAFPITGEIMRRISSELLERRTP